MQREEDTHDEDHAASHGERYEEVERRLLEPCEADGTLCLRCLGVAAWGAWGCGLHHRMGCSLHHVLLMALLTVDLLTMPAR